MFSLSILVATSLFSASVAKPSQKSASFTDLPTATITPSAGPVVNHGIDLTASVDFIYWKSSLSGLEYAFSGVHDVDSFVGATESVDRGHLQTPEFTFEPGLKIGLNWLTGHDGWDVSLQYTWLSEQRTNNSIAAREGLGVGTSFPTVFSDGSWYYADILSGAAAWHQNFNVLDAKLGRDFFISRTITLRPHIGMKFGWINEKLNLLYHTYDEVSGDTTIDSPVLHCVYKQDMWGLGIRTGLDSVWRFTKHWGFYGDLAFTALWSYFDTRDKQRQTSANVVPVGTLNSGEHLQKIINVVELGLGACYMTWFKEDRYQFLIQAGWEEQVWLEFNNIPNISIPLPGSLSLQGLTVKTSLAF